MDIHLLIFDVEHLSRDEILKLNQIVFFFVVSVYSPMFIMIHSKPSATDGPYLTLFERDLLLAYKTVNLF